MLAMNESGSSTPGSYRAGIEVDVVWMAVEFSCDAPALATALVETGLSAVEGIEFDAGWFEFATALTGIPPESKDAAEFVVAGEAGWERPSRIRIDFADM
jgi:hypothetical protein